MVQIRVSGWGEATSAPDEASFSFRCQGAGVDAQVALAQATEAASAVLERLDELGVAERRRGVQNATVHPRVRWVQDREVREGWDANATVECTIDDAAEAFELLDRTSTLERVSIHGPQWRIRPDNPAHDLARRRAVEDARTRAESYASAAGVEIGALLELIEGGSPSPAPMMRGMAMAEAAPLEAADQIVHAAVTMVFEAI